MSAGDSGSSLELASVSDAAFLFAFLKKKDFSPFAGFSDFSAFSSFFEASAAAAGVLADASEASAAPGKTPACSTGDFAATLSCSTAGVALFSSCFSVCLFLSEDFAPALAFLLQRLLLCPFLQSGKKLRQEG